MCDLTRMIVNDSFQSDIALNLMSINRLTTEMQASQASFMIKRTKKRIKFK